MVGARVLGICMRTDFTLFLAYSPDWPAARILWLICFVGSTLYMFCWDVFMDWGLGRWNSRHRLLRDKLVWHEHKWVNCGELDRYVLFLSHGNIQVYFYCIVSNFFLRFFWTVTITPVPIYIGMPSEFLNDIAASVEIIRYVCTTRCIFPVVDFTAILHT